jgi:hypothetical protein
VLPYLVMNYLYKRSNRFWRLLIKHRLTAAVWRPLLDRSRRRHLRLRPRLAATSLSDEHPGTAHASHCVSAGV